MDYHNTNWKNYGPRVTNVEAHNQISLLVAYGVKEIHDVLDGKQETLEEIHTILEGKYDNMSHKVAKFLSFC